MPTGRDMSWLWDVDFTSLRASGVAMVSGVRAWDMALRLGYDQVPVADTNTDLEQAVTAFVNANPGTRKHIYCTYTAMLKPAPYWAASPKYGTRAWASNYPLAPARHLPPAGGHGEE